MPIVFCILHVCTHDTTVAWVECSRLQHTKAIIVWWRRRWQRWRHCTRQQTRYKTILIINKSIIQQQTCPIIIDITIGIISAPFPRSRTSDTLQSHTPQPLHHKQIETNYSREQNRSQWKLRNWVWYESYVRWMVKTTIIVCDQATPCWREMLSLTYHVQL